MTDENTLTSRAASSEDMQRDKEAASLATPPPETQQDVHHAEPGSDSDEPEKFKLPMRSWLAFLTLAVLTLMVALDGTSISVAIPVRNNSYLQGLYVRILTDT